MPFKHLRGQTRNAREVDSDMTDLYLDTPIGQFTSMSAALPALTRLQTVSHEARAMICDVVWACEETSCLAPSDKGQ